MAYIQYKDHGLNRYFKLPEDKMAVFGREDHTDFQLLMDAMISREHFAIEKTEEGKFLLIDLGAKNGTFHNGRLLESNEIVQLVHGDTIKAGSQSFVFYAQMPQKESTQELLNDVAKSIDSGKGFSTIMSEIIGSGKKKKK